MTVPDSSRPRAAIVPLAFLLLCAAGLAPAPADAEVTRAYVRCQECLTDPFIVTKAAGPPQTETIRFSSFAGAGYELRFDSPTPVHAIVRLNGADLVDFRPSAGVLRNYRVPVTLADHNELEIVMRGRPTQLEVAILATPSASLPSCGPPELKAVFTDPLMDPDELVAVQPLGSLNAPSHTLPTHHIYFDPPQTAPPGVSRYEVHAPGKARVVAVEYDVGDDDYNIFLRPCDEVRMYLLHVDELSSRIAARLGDRQRWWPVPALLPDTDGLPGIALTAWVVEGGELLGYSDASFQPGIDVGLIDERQPELPFANRDRYLIPTETVPGLDPALVDRIIREIAPMRLKQFCALDYFDSAIAAPYQLKLGRFDGSILRTDPPLCGEHMQDIPGTAQGNWFRPTLDGDASTAVDESDDFAFVHDHVVTSRPVISIGLRGPLIFSGTVLVNEISYDADGIAGNRINEDPSTIVPGPLHCFENLYWRGGPVGGRMLVRLTDAATLHVAHTTLPLDCPALLAISPGDALLDALDAIDYER